MRSLLLLSSVVCALAACGGAPGAPPRATPASPGPAAPPVAAPAPAPAPAAPPPVSEGPTAEDTLRWLLTSLTASAPVTRAEVESRFAPSFLQAVPPDEVVQLLSVLQVQLPPLEVLKQEGSPPRALSAWLRSKSGGLRVDITMSSSTPRKIEGLLLRAASVEPPPRDYKEASRQLAATGAARHIYVARLDDRGTCTPVFADRVNERLAIASTSKLWVLLALDDKLRRTPSLSWDTKLALREEAKSLGAGALQAEPAGTEHTVRELATQMISISDNTATDHLIDFVGEPAIARVLTQVRHGKPALHRPYLRTRDLFSLKLSATGDELAAYRKASVPAKRRVLAELRQRPIDPTSALASWTAPRALDLEWFATGPELCRTFAALLARANHDPKSELLQILGKNPGTEADPSRWRYVGFKGGSEPGVMYLAYLLQRSDGAWLVATIGVNDPARTLDEGAIANVATGVLSVLAGQATPAGAAPAAGVSGAGPAPADVSGAGPAPASPRK